MDKDKFTINEIIMIVMSFIDDLEKEQLYGIKDEEINLPYYVKYKMDNMSSIEYSDFISIIEDISREAYDMKTGELNELNLIHQQIKIMAEELLKGYIK